MVQTLPNGDASGRFGVWPTWMLAELLTTSRCRFGPKALELTPNSQPLNPADAGSLDFCGTIRSGQAL